MELHPLQQTQCDFRLRLACGDGGGIGDDVRFQPLIFHGIQTCHGHLPFFESTTSYNSGSKRNFIRRDGTRQHLVEDRQRLHPLAGSSARCHGCTVRNQIRLRHASECLDGIDPLLASSANGNDSIVRNRRWLYVPHVHLLQQGQGPLPILVTRTCGDRQIILADLVAGSSLRRIITGDARTLFTCLRDTRTLWR